MDPAPSQQQPGKQFKQRHLVLLALGLLVCVGLIDWWWDLQKETRYDAAIFQAAEQYAVDPALVKAVVWRESRFNPRVRGRVGELGLMQIRPLTAQEWAEAQSKGRTFEGDLFAPETNLQVGSWYLAKLLRRYARTDNPTAYALADYNAGRSNVLRWNKGAAVTNGTAFIEQITFPGTQEYVRSIIRRLGRYQALRNHKPS